MSSRRRFLKSSTLAAAGMLAFPAWTAPSKSNRKLGVALVGLGYYSTDLLAPALQRTRYCELRGIVTGSPQKIPVWQKQYNIPDKNFYNYQNFDEVANNDDIDVIYVVLPPSMHAAFTIRAARAGKHVWCEKPMAMTAAECQSMIDGCRTNKVSLAIGYRMQHEPITQKIIGFRKSEPFGKLMKVNAAAGYFDGRSDHWKQKRSMGGGAIYDMGVYPLNAARYTIGLEPVAVTAKQSTTRPEIYQQTDETMVFDLEFPKGIVAHCETSLGKSMNSLRVDCANGWYRLEPFQAYSGIAGDASDGQRFKSNIENQQAKQMDDDALAILNKTQLLVPGEEGMRDIRVVEAIIRSAMSNQRVSIDH